MSGASNQRRQQCSAAALILLLAAADAHAARPMIVDDARIVDPGACQVEAWRRFNRDSQENWVLPGCNLSGNVELTLGSAELPVDDLGVRVADQHRAGAEQEVDVFLPVFVPDAATLALADNDLGGEIAKGAAGQYALRRLKDVLAVCPIHDPHSQLGSSWG